MEMTQPSQGAAGAASKMKSKVETVIRGNPIEIALVVAALVVAVLILLFMVFRKNNKDDKDDKDKSQESMSSRYRRTRLHPPNFRHGGNLPLWSLGSEHAGGHLAHALSEGPISNYNRAPLDLDTYGDPANWRGVQNRQDLEDVGVLSPEEGPRGMYMCGSSPNIYAVEEMMQLKNAGIDPDVRL